jgi:hypothetical protein
MHAVDAMRKKTAGNELGGIQKRSFYFRGIQHLGRLVGGTDALILQTLPLLSDIGIAAVEIAVVGIAACTRYYCLGRFYNSSIGTMTRCPFYLYASHAYDLFISKVELGLLVNVTWYCSRRVWPSRVRAVCCSVRGCLNETDIIYN